MDSLTKFALDILRDRNFSRMDEEVREEVLSLFIDDHRKPSKEGRRTLALNSACWQSKWESPDWRCFQWMYLWPVTKRKYVRFWHKLQTLFRDRLSIIA